MQEFSITRITNFLAVAAMLALLGSGCDQVGDVVDDVKSKVTGTDESTAEEQPVAADEKPAPAPRPKPKAPEPNPNEIAARFLELEPGEISDGALAALTASPEAASMVEELEIRGRAITGKGIRLLGKLENLRVLTIASTSLTAEELQHLEGAQSLIQLTIRKTAADDGVVSGLTNALNLESLDLSGTRISAQSAASLVQMQNLRSLALNSTSVNDETIAAISNLGLTSLDISRTRITNASLPIILKMRSLERLNVSSTGVSGDGFKGFSRSELKYLNVSETNFGVPGFMAIKGMRSLEDLYVFRAGLVEHKKANVFRSFPELRTLNAGANAITDAGMDVFFKGHKTLERLILRENSKITNKGLSYLVGIKTLRQLDVHGTRCTKAGADALKAEIPECTISASMGQ